MSKSKNKVAYGSSLLKEATHRVVHAIHHDSIEHTISIPFQKGIEVTERKFTVEFLEEIGFLNFDKLSNYIK